MNTLYEQIQQAVAYIRTRTSLQPRFGLILGTGLGDLADEIVPDQVIPYADIPHFAVSTVASHAGKLILGHLAGMPVVCMAGRFHYYEGYSMQQITFPVRVMKFLGVERLMISNASGGLNPEYQAGDLVFVKDHINWQPDNPLRGMNDERLGPRFPDMLHVYDRRLNARALALAAQWGIRAHEGVYLALSGPNLETPAECHFMQLIGADVVGMSTVPEVIVAKHSSLPVWVVSVVANQGHTPLSTQETSLEDVVAAVCEAAPRLRRIVTQVLSECAAVALG